MSAEILDGKKLSVRVLENLKEEVIKLKAKGIEACLDVIIVGDDHGSKLYVESKRKACELIGIKSNIHYYAGDVKQEEIMNLIDKLNKDSKVSGILVQLPLPDYFNESIVLGAILPIKDVDGFAPYNFGRLVSGNTIFEPCTPKGIIELIKESGIEIEGKECVVIGRSNIVGKPVALLLMANNATVTICHSKTKNMIEITKRADILVVAIGKPKFLKKEMVKSGAVVIDVGINKLDGKTVGDVDFESVKEVAMAITPVPGGVGPMTIAMLMKNTLEASIMQQMGK